MGWAERVTGFTIFGTEPGRRFVAALLAVALTVAGCQGEPDASTPKTGELSGKVSAERFRTHMEVLADDGMAGRETGSEGYLMAARYAASQFEGFGLVPAGDGAGFFQWVPFLSTRLDPESPRLLVHRGREEIDFAFPDDYVVYAGFTAGEQSVTADLAFVGYGIQAPAFGHDDFAGIDVDGKILVRLTGAPPQFTPDERAFYSSSAVKNALAVERGAVGLITVRTPVDLPRLPWQRYLSAIGSADMSWTLPDGVPHEAFPQIVAEAVVSEAGAASLFDLAGHDLEVQFARHESGQTDSFDMSLAATIGSRSVTERLSAPNVVAMIPGSDPRLRHEFVLYTGHLDHLGVRPSGTGDDIHNGAYDNSAGIATILESARIMAGSASRVRRSVLFAALTGEEKGLQGSSFMAENPPVPIACIVAVINVDMPYLGFPIGQIMGLGVEHSSLEASLKGAAGVVGLDFISDPRPELVRFIRSDQFSFVKRGIPGLNLKPGPLSADQRFDGGAMHGEYLANHYHQPSDELHLPFSPEGAKRFARAALELGLSIANADSRPRWNAGDFFGERFAGAGATGAECAPSSR